ncbi:AlpA family phage regulatory protein [Variovorax guangxiensis]|uniref:AlpA family phage regulatory protein n=1 Tax=Variovorax guangxiensis TaxID=1775474 RepID=A0A433MT01_9BURK|nr:AlpA family phage regulatory protein [Variovorax guangxiensis]RUR70993.1 AlpA family phage regulatory protein [Variovorax guangxiensis]
MLQKPGIEPHHNQIYRTSRSTPVRNHRDGGHAAPLPKYLRLAQLVPDVVPVSPATIWRWVKAGNFPAPIKLTAHVTAWKLEEVVAWLEARSLDPA